MTKRLLILLIILTPIVVLGVGSTKRIINLPGFTADRVLIVNSSNEIDDTNISEAELDLLDGVAGVLVTEAGTSTLTNKTIDADGTGNSITNIENADIKAGAAIAVNKLEALTASRAVVTDGSGFVSASTTTSAEIDLLAGKTALAEQSELVAINYYDDFQANTIGNVSEFDDGGSIVDGTGGSPANLATSSETTDPLSQTASYKLSKDTGADASGEGFSITTDTPDRTSTVGGETVYITFNYETSANYDNSSSSEQVSIYVYRVGSNTLEACNARDVLSGSFTNALPVAPDGGQYQCTTTLSSSDTSVRVIFGVTGTGTSTWDLVVDKIKVGPDATVTGPIVTEWQNYTLVINAVTTAPTTGTTPTANAEWRRVGDTMEIRYDLEQTSSGTAGSGIYLFPIPSGYTIDTAKIAVSTANVLGNVGSATARATAEGLANGYMRAYSTTQLTMVVGNSANADNTVSSATFDLADSAVVYSFKVAVPILEWSNSNAILSTTQVDHSTLKVFGEGNGGTSITAFTTDVDFTEVTDSHSAWSGTVFTAPTKMRVLFTGSIRTTAGITSTVRTYINGTASKATGVEVSGSVLPFAGIEDLEAGDQLSFRLEAAATLSNEVLLHHLEISPIPDFSTFSVYGNYEIVNGSATTASYSITADQWGDLTSFTLKPGTWDCYTNTYWNANGAVTTGDVGVGFGTTSGNNSPGATPSLHYTFTDKLDTSGTVNAMHFRRTPITVTTPTTYYLKAYAESSTTNLQVAYTYVCKKDK